MFSQEQPDMQSSYIGPPLIIVGTFTVSFPYLPLGQILISSNIYLMLELNLYVLYD